MISPFCARAGNRILGGSNDFVQSDYRYKRRCLQNHLPVVADSRQRESHHLRKKNPAKHLPARESECGPGFDLSFRNGHDSASKCLSKIGAVDEPENAYAGEKRIDIDLGLVQGISKLVQPILSAVV